MNNNLLNLENKTILVTGSSSGIGKSIAIEASKIGGKLILNGRNETRLRETLDLLSGDSHEICGADISEEEEIKSMVSKCTPLDGLVICSGVNDKALLKTITIDKINKVFGTNIIGPILLIKEFLKQKKIKKGCSILLISSISSEYATISNSLYASSKGAIESFARVAAIELSSRGIRVNTIRPGIIETPMLKKYPMEDSLDNFINNIPLGRIGAPEDIAYASLFLLSDLASWITGTTLIIDGGITLR